MNAPIPLSVLDKLFYALELLGYTPMARIHFDLQGDLPDISLLRQAYADSLERYPLFNATLNEQPSLLQWKLHWVPAPTADPAQAVTLHDYSGLPPDAARQQFHRLQFDPLAGYDSRVHAPCTVFLCRFPGDMHKLLFFFHHAAVDAFGYSLYLQDLLTTYNRLAGSRSDLPPQAVPPAGAPSTLLPETVGGKCLGFLQGAAVIARHVLKRAGRDAIKLIYGTTSFSGGLNAVQRCVPAERMQRYLQTAKALQTTFTTVLITAQAAALYRWKMRRGEPTGPVSIQVHTDLRRNKRDFEEIANRFSVFLIATAPQDLQDLRRLVGTVNRQSRQAQATGMPDKIICMAWPLDLRIARRLLPLWGNFILNNQRFGDSFQLSNAGRVWAERDGTTRITQLGKAQLTACYMSGPPIPAMGSYTGVCTFRDQLFLSFNYFTWAMTDREAEAFVNEIEAVLEEIAGLAGLA